MIKKILSKENLTKENIKNVIIIFLSLALIISLAYSCGKSQKTSTNNSDTLIIKDAYKDTYYENIDIGELYLKDYGDFTNIYIPVKNNGDKSINDISIYFLNSKNQITSEESVWNRNEWIVSNSTLDLSSQSYYDEDLADVYGIKITRYYYELEDGSSGSYELQTPIVFNVNK